MKKLITLFLILFSIISQAQTQGQNIIIGKGKLEGILYNIKSGATDTIIALHQDSLGQFKFMNAADPVNALDVVNYRTLLFATSGINWDSLLIDHSDYMTKQVYDAADISEQLVGVQAYQVLVNKTLISPVIANFTNATHNHTTNATGGLLSSDNIIQGITNLYSQWLKSGSNIYRMSSVGINTATPQSDLDVAGRTRTEIMEVTNSVLFDGLTVTDIAIGTSNNDKFVTQGYVDDAITISGGYTNEEAQDAVGTILDNDSIGDIDFVYDDATPAISATVQDDSHGHTALTISGLTTASFEDDSISQWNNDVGYITNSNEIDGIFAADSANIIHWPDTISKVATAYDLSLLNTAGNLSNVVYLNNTQTITGQKTFSNITTRFGSTGAASYVQLFSSSYPQILFTTATDTRLLFRNGNLLQWRFDGTNDGVIYHSLNSNLGTVAWNASQYLLNGTNINTAGTLTNVAYKNQNNNFTTAQTIAGRVQSTTAKFMTVGTATGVKVLGLDADSLLTTNISIDTSQINNLTEFVENQMSQPVQELTFSDTIIFDVDESNNAMVTMTGNVDVLNLNNVQDGESGTVVIIQDDNGGWGIEAVQSAGLVVKYVYIDTVDYVTTEIDPTVSTLVKSIDAADTTRWGIDTDTQLSEAEVDSYVSDNGYLTDDSNYAKLNSTNTFAGVQSYSTGFTFNNDRQIVDKAYVDAIASGNMPKLPVDVATTANITLSGAQTIDSYSATAGMRVLVKNQTTTSQNGVYTVAAGAWARSTDLDTWTELYKAYVAVLNGGQSGSSFVCTIASTGTLGSDAITWVLYSAPTNITAGIGLDKSGNEISVEFGGTGTATTVSRTDHTQAATTIGAGAISDTEFSYLDNATSNIQTQLNAKATGTTGLLTETVTGLQFSGTPSVIGGASALSLSTGYEIPTTTGINSWNTAYNDKINSATVLGTTVKTIRLTQQDGTYIDASFTDLNTGGSSLFTDSGGAFSYLTDTSEDLGIGANTDLGDYKLQVTGNQFLKGNAKFSTNGVVPAFLEMEDIESTVITPTTFHGALFVDADSLWFKMSGGTSRNLLRNTNTNLSFSGTSSPITLNSSNGTDVTFTKNSFIELTGTSGNMTIGANLGLLTNDATATVSDYIPWIDSGEDNKMTISQLKTLIGTSIWTQNGNFIDMVDITDQVRIGNNTATGTWDLYIEGQISTGYLGSRGIIAATDYISTEEYIISDYLTTRNVSSMSATVPNEGNFYSKTDNKAYFQANNVEFDLTNTVEKFRTIAVNTTLTTTDKIVFVSAGGTVVTFPTVPAGKIYMIRNIAGSSITVPTYTILGANTTATTVASYQCVTLCYTGSAWYQLD